MRRILGTVAVGGLMAAGMVGGAGAASAASTDTDLTVRSSVTKTLDGTNFLRCRRTNCRG